MHGLGNSIIEASVQNDKANREAQDTPLGGMYTSVGLDRAHKEADLNSEDILMLRQMVAAGLGGGMF